MQAGQDAGAVPEVPRQHRGGEPGGVPEVHRRQGARNQLHLPVRDSALLQWTGNGADGITDLRSSDASAGAGGGAGCAATGWDAAGRQIR